MANDGEQCTVIWVTRRHAELLTADGTTLHARYTRHQRPAVGDRVRAARSAKTWQVTHIERRGAVLQRRAPHSGRRQVLAANLDLVVIVTAVGWQFRSRLVDRLLVMATVEGIEPVLVANKIDRELELELTIESIQSYAELGVTVVLTSALERRGLDDFREILSGKTAALVGHSGVGKSALLNALVPGAEQRIGELSAATGTGRHCTTSAKAFPFDGGGLLIDMPGVRLFGLVAVDAAELARGFVEIAPHAASCHFPNCTHSHEPSCAVRDAVEEGEIEEERYDSYLRLLDEIQEVE